MSMPSSLADPIGRALVVPGQHGTLHALAWSALTVSAEEETNCVGDGDQSDQVSAP